MRTWKEITEEPWFVPQYIRMFVTAPERNLGDHIVGIIIDGRIDKSTIPSCWHAYDVRHTEEDWGEPATVEKNVIVNFFGTLLVERELKLSKESVLPCLEVKSWSYVDWEEMAYDALEEAGADSIEIDNLIVHWDNLDTPANNVKYLLS